MCVGDEIKKLRMQKGISQKELADLLLISRQTISKWELGKSVPELVYIIQLADYFNVTLDQLVGRKPQTFLQKYFGQKENGGDETMKTINTEGSNFYSSFSNDIKGLLKNGKRIAALVGIDDKEYPQGYIKYSAGTPNCVLSINENGIEIMQLGKNIGLFMNNQKELLYRFDYEEINSIELSIKKVADILGGRYVLFINLETNKDNCILKFWIDSLKPAILIWNSPKLATVNKIVSDKLASILSMNHLETIYEDIEKGLDELPYFMDNK
ncbi:helix-turn-helix domain-containing protein [Carnobacterium sp. FSL E2-0243]|uniref:helix-turn-helix domain-containing protein n=1 Tax=Carnobacterium sp. FSL E2-0243 TaxID=2921365 RepID=UPI0030FB62BE